MCSYLRYVDWNDCHYGATLELVCNETSATVISNRHIISYKSSLKMLSAVHLALNFNLSFRGLCKSIFKHIPGCILLKLVGAFWRHCDVRSPTFCSLYYNPAEKTSMTLILVCTGPLQLTLCLHPNMFKNGRCPGLVHTDIFSFSYLV